MRGSRSSYLFISLSFLLVAIGAFPGTSYKYILAELMIWSVFAMAFDLLYGYTGQFSFGQALFFALGSYGMALSILRLGLGVWLALLVAILVSAFFAACVGFLAVRLTADHFVLITIIFSAIFFFIAMDASWLTGADQGLIFSAPPIFRLADVELNTSDVNVNYFFVLFFFVLTYVLLRTIVGSPLGRIFVAIRENEERTKFLGYNVRLFKLVSFVLAGIFSGLSGALYSLTYMHTTARYFEISVSLMPIVWTLIGGMGTLIGPILGTFLMISLETYISFYWRYWPLLLGIFIIIFIRLGSRTRGGLAAIMERV